MHEISIAQSLIDLACETARREGAARVIRLKLQIGALSGVVTDALRFSFQLVAEGTTCEGAELEIEEVAVVVHCLQCNASGTLNNPYEFVCPGCHSPTADIRAGQELDLISLEVVDHAAACS